jgi:thiamine-phosphate pyrophosphorylase
MAERGLKLKGLYGITSADFLNQERLLLLKAIEQICKNGLNILQYRKKTPPDLAVDLLTDIKSICEQYGTLFIINDSAELAKQVDADGVHLGQEDGLISKARQILGLHKIIGVSCYNSLDLAMKAQQQGADYVAFGAVFPSPTKPNAPLASQETIEQAKQLLNIPVCVIGGINRLNLADLTQSGADMYAVVSDIFDTSDSTKSVRILLTEIKKGA